MPRASSHPVPALSCDLLERVAALSAASLYEAAGRRGALPCDLHPLQPGASLHGPVYPVLQAPGDNLWIHRAIYAASAGSVLAVSTGDRGHGYWGELMTLAALARGLAGLVIDGGVRDVGAIEHLGFPVFAAATCLRGTTKDPASTGKLGEPITIGGVRISAGDVLVGDGDGVVALPRDALDEILERAETRERVEEDVRRALAGGARLLDLVVGSDS